MMFLENLNQHQVELLDQMWNIQTKDELDTWMADLDEVDLNIVIVLRQLLIYEMIDVDTDSMKSEDFFEVNRMLSKF